MELLRQLGFATIRLPVALN